MHAEDVINLRSTPSGPDEVRGYWLVVHRWWQSNACVCVCVVLNGQLQGARFPSSFQNETHALP